MDAIVLAAGEGARLKGWTSDKPKGMITLGNSSILEHLVRGLAKSGVQRINMVVGYRKNIVMSHFGDGSQFGTKIDYVNQSNLSGTLDALSLGLQNLEKDFILVPGDNYVSSASFFPVLRILLDTSPYKLPDKTIKSSLYSSTKFLSTLGT